MDMDLQVSSGQPQIMIKQLTEYKCLSEVLNSDELISDNKQTPISARDMRAAAEY